MDSEIKGNAGEFYVLAELSRRGWTAAQTARNTRAFDILARQGSKQVAIRVVPTETLNRWLQEDFDLWVNTPGPIKAQRSKDNTRRIIHVDDNTAKIGHGYRAKLEQYIGKWDTLGDTSFSL
jgi:hypothetical protein